MKVVITEAGTSNNVGSMALIENAITIARKMHPGCSITLFCLDSDSVTKMLKKDGMLDGITVLNDLFPIPEGSILKKMVWIIQSISWILYSRFLLFFSKNISCGFCGRRKSNLVEIEQAEYVYCIGAERINDIYYKTALLSLYAIGTYIGMGKKLIHLSLTIGPVFNRTTIYLAKKILNRSYAIFVRDQKSYDILKEWNCKAPYQFRSYDIALLQQTDPSKLPLLLNEFGIKKKFVGVSCLYWSFRKAHGPVRQNEYELAIAESLDYIIEKYKYQVVFTPTVVGLGKYDDVSIGRSIIQKMKFGNEVVSIERVMSPVEMATLFSQCQFAIVTRMHAAILCSGAGRHPIISINYLYKLKEYMKNILFEEYSIDIDYTNSKDIKAFIDKLVDNYPIEYERLIKRQQYLRDVISKDLNQI